MNLKDYKWVEKILKKEFPHISLLKSLDYYEEVAICVGYRDKDGKFLMRYKIWLVVDDFDINKEKHPEYWLRSVIRYLKNDFKTKTW